MATVVNGIYVLQGIVPAEIADAPVDIKVIDLFNDSAQMFSSADVALMANGSAQLLGYFSLGEAESYRSYYPTLPSSIIGPLDPNWPGNYEVAYWTDAWKAVCTDYIDTMLALGYEGAYFDVVNEYTTTWAQANVPGGDARGEMIKLITELANYARAKSPDFKIWINSSGAEDLMLDKTLVATIDGAFEEELFYRDDGTPQRKVDTDYNLNLLNNLIAAGKPVISIEYVTGSTIIADIRAKAAAAGVGTYIANPDLSLNGVSTEGFDPSAICFASGTRIATPYGEIAIEELSVGDPVITWDGRIEAIRWIGRSHVILPRGRIVAASPIIVRRGALADNVPHTDLCVTKGHSLFIEEVLIPVENLVNQRSIAWKEDVREIAIYHLELNQHAVIIANGAPAETYRDDGNRSFLIGSTGAGAQCSSFLPCARILTGGPIVDAVWRRLSERAGPGGTAAWTHEADLHLLVDGRRVDCHVRTGDRVSFRLPSGCRIVRIRSRSCIPAQFGEVRDPRRLGVALRRVALWQGRAVTVVEADHPALADGFYDYEPNEGHRWTDGDAGLPPFLFAGSSTAGELELSVVYARQYTVERVQWDAVA